MTERELIKLEATIKGKMREVREKRLSLKDSGLGGMMNTLKKVDEALFEKMMADYKTLVADTSIIR